jgi:hypothetical protein
MSQVEDTAMKDQTGLSRRRVLAGAAGAGAAALLGSRLAFAQDATPDTEDATDDTATPEVDGATEDATTDETTDLLAEVDEAIALVQADRDAVETTADLTVVDQVIAQATTLRGRVESAADEAEARRAARAAIATARAAGDLIEAQLAAYGLPSQQASASRTLADAFETIDEAGTEVGESTDTDATALVTVAQQLYQSAFDLYGAGTYVQAARTARVASTLASVGVLLVTSEGAGGFGPGVDGGNRGRGRGRPGPPDDGDQPLGDESGEEPVEVPEPTF